MKKREIGGREKQLGQIRGERKEERKGEKEGTKEEE